MGFCPDRGIGGFFFLVFFNLKLPFTEDEDDESDPDDMEDDKETK